MSLRLRPIRRSPIAAWNGRLEALHFGVADYAASNKARTVNIGGLNPDYPGDQWHFALSRMTPGALASDMPSHLDVEGPRAGDPEPIAQVHDGIPNADRRRPANEA